MVALSVLDRAQPRPLIVRFGAMGDMVILLTLIRALHARFGQPVDVVTGGSWSRPLLAGHPSVAAIHVLGSRKRPYWLSPEQRRLVAWLRSRPPGPVWVCDRDDKCRWLLTRAGLQQALIADARDCPRLPGEHQVDRWWRFAQQPLAPLTELPQLRGVELERAVGCARSVPPLHVAEPSRHALDRWFTERGLAGRPLVLIQAGNKRTMRSWIRRRRATNTKYWPETRWAEVIDGIAALEPEAHVLLLGVPSEAKLNDDVVRLLRTPRVHNVASEMPIERLLPLQERAIGMVSVDTGPAHSAAALGCPLVVLFGASDPSLYTPRSPNDTVTALTGRIDGAPSILGIAPADVLAAWQRVRSSGSRSGSQSAAR